MSQQLNVQIDTVQQSVTAGCALSRGGSAPSRLLIVDDERLIVDSLAAILRRSGFDVLTAYNGHAALELALETPPDLLITDIAMPGMDGVELAIRIVGALPTCKVLLFSAHASYLDLTPARRQGYDFPLLTKPMHPKKMIERVFESLGATMALAS